MNQVMLLPMEKTATMLALRWKEGQTLMIMMSMIIKKKKGKQRKVKEKKKRKTTKVRKASQL